jgi:hypothetical protein
VVVSKIVKELMEEDSHSANKCTNTELQILVSALEDQFKKLIQVEAR